MFCCGAVYINEPWQFYTAVALSIASYIFCIAVILTEKKQHSWSYSQILRHIGNNSRQRSIENLDFFSKGKATTLFPLKRRNNWIRIARTIYIQEDDSDRVTVLEYSATELLLYWRRSRDCAQLGLLVCQPWGTQLSPSYHQIRRFASPYGVWILWDGKHGTGGIIIHPIEKG